MTIHKGQTITVDGFEVRVIRITRKYVDYATAYDLTVGAFVSVRVDVFRKMFREGRVQ